MAGANVIMIKKDNFENEVMKSDKPVLIDFWAQWCGPCRMLGPVIDELADDYAGKAKVGKINVDEENELASLFKVMSIPTVMVFKNGQVAAKVVGARPKAELAKMIDQNI